MTDSFSRVIGTPRDRLPELDNYERTEADLTQAVNDRIDENILDTKDFFNQMVQIAELQQKSRDANLNAIAELTGKVAEFREVRRQTKSVRDNIAQANLRMTMADRSLEMLNEDQFKFEDAQFYNEVANDKISPSQKDFLSVLDQPDGVEMSVRQFKQAVIDDGGFYGGIKEMLYKNGWDEIETLAEAKDLYGGSEEIAVLSLFVAAQKAGIDTDSPQFRKMFRNELYPQMVARKENTLQAWEGRRDRLASQRADKKVQFDIKDTIQSYIPAGPNQVEFQPNIDGTGGLVERIMLRKNLDRKRALQFLTTSVATQIRNGDLLPTDGVNFKDVLRFTSKQQQGKQVAFNELQIGNNDQFIDTAISDIDRAIDSVQQDPNTKVKKASDRFYETKVLPLLQEYGSFDDIPPERYADLETDWANDPILRFTEFPEYIKGGYSKTQTGTRFSNSSYSNRIGKANFLDNVKEEMKNSFSTNLALGAKGKESGYKLTTLEGFELDKAFGALEEQYYLDRRDNANATDAQILGGPNGNDGLIAKYTKKLLDRDYKEAAQPYVTSQVDMAQIATKIIQDNTILDAEGYLSIHELDQLKEARLWFLRKGGDVPQFWKDLAKKTGLDPRKLMERRLIATGGYDPEKMRIVKDNPYPELNEFQLADLQRNPTISKGIRLFYKRDGNTAAVVIDASRQRDSEGNYQEDGHYEFGRNGGTKRDRTGGDNLNMASVEMLSKRGATNWGRYGFTSGEIKLIMSSGKIDRNAEFNEDTQTQMLAVLYEKQLEQKNAIRGVEIDGKTFWRLNDLTKVEEKAVEEFFPALKEADLFGNWSTMSQDLIDIVFSRPTGRRVVEPKKKTKRGRR
jgi:hypothetical protein